MPDQPEPWIEAFKQFLSPKDYWYAIVSALIGALLGIKWTKGQDAKEQLKRRSNSLKRLRESIDFNLNLLTIATDKLEEADPAIPNFPFDSAQLNHFITACHDFLNEDVVRKLDWERFQLEHLAGKFVILNSAVVSAKGNLNLTRDEKEYFLLNVQSLLAHIRQTHASLATLKQSVPPL